MTEQVIVPYSSNNNIYNHDMLNNLNHLVKEYEVEIESNQKIHKKVKYNNPNDYDKIIQITSTEPIIYVKTDKLVLDYKSSKYIRLIINSPQTLGTYTCFIVIENTTLKEENKIEEILKFKIKVY